MALEACRRCDVTSASAVWRLRRLKGGRTAADGGRCGRHGRDVGLYGPTASHASWYVVADVLLQSFVNIVVLQAENTNENLIKFFLRFWSHQSRFLFIFCNSSYNTFIHTSIRVISSLLSAQQRASLGCRAGIPTSKPTHYELSELRRTLLSYAKKFAKYSYYQRNAIMITIAD